VVITDGSLPGMNGPDLCRNIRGNDSGQYTCLIILARQNDVANLVEGMEAGADDFIAKPSAGRNSLSARGPG
jgi:putative two-component system response regulator